MELEKRKREDDRGANAKKGKAPEDREGSKAAVPEDEEVEEFFAILKRIHVAVKYFQKRNGYSCSDRELMAVPWNLEFEREDFDGANKETERSEGNRSVDLDLNSVPASDVSDHAD